MCLVCDLTFDRIQKINQHILKDLLCCLNKWTKMQRCTNVSLRINVVTLFNHEGAEEALHNDSCEVFFLYFFKIKAIKHFSETE